MAERVGDVRHARGTPELTRAPEPLLKIADDRFAGDEEEVGEDMPRPDEEPVGPDERLRARGEETEDDADGHAAEHVEWVMNTDHHARERAGDPEQENGHAIAR